MEFKFILSNLIASCHRNNIAKTTMTTRTADTAMVNSYFNPGKASIPWWWWWCPVKMAH